MRRVITLNDGSEIGPEYLKAELTGTFDARARIGGSSSLPPAGASMREAERLLLEATLEVTGGNRTRTAEILGVSLRTIRNKIREHGLPPRRFA
jgi:DNA-binding NtrC family response regulator